MEPEIEPEQPRRLLLAGATSNYPKLGAGHDRPLDTILSEIVELFTGPLRYERVASEYSHNPTAQDMRNLDRWFGSPERNPSDWIVFYYSGHGELVGEGSLYLLTTDSEPYQFVSTAFSFHEFANLISSRMTAVRNRRVKNLLVILDVCYAGQGTMELAGQLSKLFHRACNGAFYVLGSAQAREEADAGVFSRALVDAIRDLGLRSVQQRWLFLDQLVPAINQRLKIQTCVRSVVDAPLEEMQFFPNPSFVDTGGQPVEAQEAHRAIHEQEFREHWGPRARGVEFDFQTGSYFVGRHAALSELNAFLDGASTQLKILTGSPGAGKSAILGRLVLERKLDLAIHAHAKTLADCTSRLAQVLGVPARLEKVIEKLNQPGEPVRILVDALDEAVEPLQIASDLLVPIGSLPRVRLIVGTRSHLLKQFRDPQILNLDEARYNHFEDIVTYAEMRLLRSADEKLARTPYRNQPSLARSLAEYIAKRSNANFLVARLYAEHYLAQSRAMAPPPIEDADLPTKVNAAFEMYLAQFGPHEAMVRDFLLALKFAEGKGLPWDNIWARVAGALAGVEYTDEDTRWVLANAGAFVLESLDLGRAVYRLYHQALADVLSADRQEAEPQAAITTALVASVPLASDASPDWMLANPYVRTHLATHAANCGRLSEFLSDPRFLLAADPDRLLAAINTAPPKNLPMHLVFVYRQAVSHLRGKPPGTAVAYLELVARQRGTLELAERTRALPFERPWTPAFALWSPEAPFTTIARGESEITSLSVAQDENGRPVAVIGRANSWVETCAIETDTTTPQMSHYSGSPALNVLMVNSPLGPITVAFRESGILDTTRLSTKERFSISTSKDTVSAMCAGEIAGEVVLFVSYRSGTLCRYSLPDLKLLSKSDRTTRVGIEDMLLTRSKGDSVLLWLTQDFTNASGFHQDLRMWHAETLEELWSHRYVSSVFPATIEQITYPGQNLVLICIGDKGFEIWDIDRLEIVTTNNSPCDRAWAIAQDGKYTVVSVGEHERGSTRPLANDSTDLVLVELPFAPKGKFISSSFPIQNRNCFMSADPYQAVVWNLQELVPFLLNSEALNWFRALHHTSELAFDPQENHLYAAMGTQNRIIGMNPVTGQMMQDLEFEKVYGIAFNQRGELLANNSSGLIRFPPSRNSAPERRHALSDLFSTPASVCVTRHLGLALGGDPLELKVINFESDRQISVWDDFEDDNGRLPVMASVDDNATFRLAFCDLDNRVLFAELLLVKEEVVRITNYKWHRTPKDAGHVSRLAATTLGTLSVAAAATFYGMLVLFSFRDARLIASKRNCHVGTISALAFGSYAGESRLASGGEDGVVRIWSLPLTRIETCINDTLECVLEIEVGAPVNTIAWSGKKLAVGTNQGTVLFDLAE